MIGGLLQRNVLIGLGVGVILGLLLGYVLGTQTVEFKPSRDDVRMVADSYSLNGNADLAKTRLAGLSKDDRDRYITELFNDANKPNRTLEAQRFASLAKVLGSPTNLPPVVSAPPASSSSSASGTTPITGTLPTAPGTSSAASVAPTPRTVPVATPTPASSPSLIDSILPIVLILVVVIIVVVVGLIFVTRILPNLRKGRTARRTATTETQEDVTQWTERVSGGSGVAPAPTTQPGGLGRFVPQYTLGNDNYDTSYSLETSRGEFLGECGMGISETIGEGKPDKVTAFDLWLFDKADVRTVTQIIMSEYSFNDQTLRTKLRDKGEAVLAEKGKTIHLETQSLRIDAQIVELIYASNPNLAPNSHFQKLIIEIVPTLKNR